MAKFSDGSELLKCSFCGESQKDAMKLISGDGVCICAECIDRFKLIVEDELETARLGVS